MKTFKQYFTEGTEEEVPFKTLDDLLHSTMEMLGDYGAYEANLRPAESVDRGVEALQEYVEVYLAGLGFGHSQSLRQKMPKKLKEYCIVRSIHLMDTNTH